MVYRDVVPQTGIADNRKQRNGERCDDRLLGGKCEEKGYNA